MAIVVRAVYRAALCFAAWKLVHGSLRICIIKHLLWPDVHQLCEDTRVAWCDPWVLIKLTPKGVDSSFPFPSLPFPCLSFPFLPFLSSPLDMRSVHMDM